MWIPKDVLFHLPTPGIPKFIYDCESGQQKKWPQVSLSFFFNSSVRISFCVHFRFCSTHPLALSDCDHLRSRRMLEKKILIRLPPISVSCQLRGYCRYRTAVQTLRNCTLHFQLEVRMRKERANANIQMNGRHVGLDRWRHERFRSRSGFIPLDSGRSASPSL